MDLIKAANKLREAGQAVQEKMNEITSFADTFAAGTHRIAPRVELDRYLQLCDDLEYSLGEHEQARQRFLSLIRGDE